MQSVALNQKVQFLPISKSNSSYAECQVKLLQDTSVNEKVCKCKSNTRLDIISAKNNNSFFTFFLKITIDLAESLLSLGFARHANFSIKDSKDQQLKSYLIKLKKAQQKASKQSLPWPIDLILSQITRLVYKKVLPSKYRLPELVR